MLVWASREEACRYQPWGPNTPAQTRAFVEATARSWDERPQTRYPYAVEVAGTVRGIGTLELHPHRQGEMLAYSVHPDLWGQGVGTQVARRLLDLGFTEHRLHRIFATCDPRNVASGRVLAKAGLVHEGRLRQNLLIRDGWRDSDLYSILAEEWSVGATDGVLPTTPTLTACPP